jgi:PPK2 family polyphosphate:nucleotide phosphotransferase
VYEIHDDRLIVPFDGSFRVADTPTAPNGGRPDGTKDELASLIDELQDLQRLLYAQDRWSLLLVFQAMDAAGKDGTIRAVMTGINPAGCQVYSFKQPSAEELDHDFLWRTAVRLPERGRIGIFNRSYYEEVLVVRVHPEILQGQRLPVRLSKPEEIWPQRFESIRDHERHLALNGTVILKFWLNVSKEEQRKRFLARLDDPEKHWKFSMGDVRERRLWDRYMHAYEEALNATSRPWAPWFAVPADDKPTMRTEVARIIVKALKGLGMRYPVVGDQDRARFKEAREALEAEG